MLGVFGLGACSVLGAGCGRRGSGTIVGAGTWNSRPEFGTLSMTSLLSACARYVRRRHGD